MILNFIINQKEKHMKTLPLIGFKANSPQQNSNITFKALPTGKIPTKPQNFERTTNGNFPQKAIRLIGKTFQTLKTILKLKLAQRKADKRLRRAEEALRASEEFLRQVAELRQLKGQITQAGLEALAQKTLDQHHKILEKLGLGLNSPKFEVRPSTPRVVN